MTARLLLADCHCSAGTFSAGFIIDSGDPVYTGLLAAGGLFVNYTASMLDTVNAHVEQRARVGHSSLLDMLARGGFLSDVYSAATPANWATSAPTTVPAAIDRLAAAVAGLLTTPVP